MAKEKKAPRCILFGESTWALLRRLAHREFVQAGLYGEKQREVLAVGC